MWRREGFEPQCLRITVVFKTTARPLGHLSVAELYRPRAAACGSGCRTRRDSRVRAAPRQRQRPQRSPLPAHAFDQSVSASVCGDGMSIERPLCSACLRRAPFSRRAVPRPTDEPAAGRFDRFDAAHGHIPLERHHVDRRRHARPRRLPPTRGACRASVETPNRRAERDETRIMIRTPAADATTGMRAAD